MGQKRCCICKRKMLGYGNNSAPIANGLCCDSCNELYVIPYRLAITYHKTAFAGIILEKVKQYDNVVVS